MSTLPDGHDLIPHGDPAMIRAAIRELAGLASVQAGLAMRYAGTGDDVGLRHAVTRWANYTTAAVQKIVNLEAANRDGGAE